MNGPNKLAPIEIVHLRDRLRAKYTGILREGGGKSDDREANFLSRALAAFTIEMLSGCQDSEAVAAVVDGSGDGGIDAIHYSESIHVLWVLQSKFHQDGTGEPGLADVAKFKMGLESLLQGHFEAFARNRTWAALIPRVASALNDRSLVVRAVLCYSGANLVSEDRRRMFEDLRSRFSITDDYFEVKFCNLTTIHDWITSANRRPGVAAVELKIRTPGWVTQPYETIYGMVALSELAALYSRHGDELVESNIRSYKGNTQVNEQISRTVRDQPEHFFYLNNGLTAYCDSFRVHNADRGKLEEKRVTANNLCIVNGAQTLGSVAKVLADSPHCGQGGFVFVKLISLARCSDPDFAKLVTKSTNFQNQIGTRDLVALDPEQERIARHLRVSGVTYRYKDGNESSVSRGNTFTLAEATTACACLMQKRAPDACARLLSNRKSLWSMEIEKDSTEKDGPEKDDPGKGAWYSMLFPPELSARAVWRAVQAQRAIRQALKNGEAGVRKQFFENSLWLITNLLFLLIRPQLGESITLTQEEVSVLADRAQEYAETLWSVCAEQGFVVASADGGWECHLPFRAVFGSATHCQQLRRLMLGRIASKGQ